MAEENQVAKNGVHAKDVHSVNSQDKILTTPLLADNNNDRRSNHGLTVFTATIFVAGEMAGSGILALSKAMAGTGWIGIPLILFSGFTACYCGIILGKCWSILEERWHEFKDEARHPYPSIGEKAGGKWAKRIVSFSIDFTVFGVAVVFLLLCSQLLQELLEDVVTMSYCYWILILAVILLPFSWLGTPVDFWPMAVGALATTAIATVLVILAVGKEYAAETVKVTYPNPTFSTFILGFATIQFSYGGATAFPTIQNDMKERSQFTKSAIYGFIILLMMYTPIAAIGYFAYGGNVQDNVLESLKPGVLRIIANVLLAAHVFFAFLIVINPLYQEIEAMLHISKKFSWKRCANRTVIMVFVVFVAESVPHFGKILNFIGASTATLTTFILPAIFYLRLCRMKDESWPERYIPLHEKVYLFIIIFIGVLSAIAGTYAALAAIISESSFSPPCYLTGMK